MIYIVFLLIIIITILLIYILLQHRKYAFKLSKIVEKYLETYNKCSFYIREYNSLKNKIHSTTFSSKQEKVKMFNGKTALIGDYFLPSCNNTKSILEDLGFDVDIAESSQYVVDKIKYGEKYDIIFSNNIYKDGTGVECLKKLKSINGFSIPVVVHTVTKNNQNYFVNDIGFDAYIEKPITKDKIIPIIEKLLNTK